MLHLYNTVKTATSKHLEK